MKYLSFLLLYPCLIYTFAATCYEFRLGFGEEECPDISSSLLSELYRGKNCLNLICTSFFGPLKANICIQKKKHEYKLMILGSNSNVTFDISTFKEDDPYTIEGLAISGSHFTLLLYDSEIAYRQSYDIKKLNLNLWNTIKPNPIGFPNNTTWIPAVDSDYYYVKDLRNIKQYLHDNTKMEEANLAGLSQRCLEWNDSIVYVPDMITTSTTTISSSTYDENIQKSYSTFEKIMVGLISAIITAVIAFISFIIFFLCYKKKESNTQQNGILPSSPPISGPTNEQQQQDPPPAYSDRINEFDARLTAMEIRTTTENNQQNNSTAQASEPTEATRLVQADTNDNSLDF